MPFRSSSSFLEHLAENGPSESRFATVDPVKMKSQQKVGLAVLDCNRADQPEALGWEFVRTRHDY